MSVTVAKLVAEITANISGLERGVNQSKAKLQELESAVAGGNQKVSSGASAWQSFNTQAGNSITSVMSSVDRLSSSINSMANQAAVAGAVMTIGLTRPIEQVLKLALGFDDLKSRVTLAFTNILGTVEKAKTKFNELLSLAMTSPFEFKGLLSYTQTMLGMGDVAEKVVPHLKAIGDAVFGMGNSDEVVQRVVLALSQMMAVGHVTGLELRELGRAGIGALGILSTAAGKSTEQMRKLIEKGLVPAKWAMESLTTGMEKRFPDFMTKMSATLQTALSNLQDFANTALGALFQPLYVSLTSGAQSMQGTLTDLRVMIEGWANDVKMKITNALLALAAIGPLTLLFAGFGKALAFILSPLGLVAALVTAVTLHLIEHKDHLVELTDAYKGYFPIALELTKSAMEAFNSVGRSLVDVFIKMAPILGGLIEILRDLFDFFNRLPPVIRDTALGLLEVVAAVALVNKGLAILGFEKTVITVTSLAGVLTSKLVPALKAVAGAMAFQAATPWVAPAVAAASKGVASPLISGGLAAFAAGRVATSSVVSPIAVAIASAIAVAIASTLSITVPLIIGGWFAHRIKSIGMESTATRIQMMGKPNYDSEINNINKLTQAYKVHPEDVSIAAQLADAWMRLRNEMKLTTKNIAGTIPDVGQASVRDTLGSSVADTLKLQAQTSHGAIKLVCTDLVNAYVEGLGGGKSLVRGAGDRYHQLIASGRAIEVPMTAARAGDAYFIHGAGVGTKAGNYWHAGMVTGDQGQTSSIRSLRNDPVGFFPGILHPGKLGNYPESNTHVLRFTNKIKDNSYTPLDMSTQEKESANENARKAIEHGQRNLEQIKQTAGAYNQINNLLKAIRDPSKIEAMISAGKLELDLTERHKETSKILFDIQSEGMSHADQALKNQLVGIARTIDATQHGIDVNKKFMDLMGELGKTALATARDLALGPSATESQKKAWDFAHESLKGYTQEQKNSIQLMQEAIVKTMRLAEVHNIIQKMRDKIQIGKVADPHMREFIGSLQGGMSEFKDLQGIGKDKEAFDLFMGSKAQDQANVMSLAIQNLGKDFETLGNKALQAAVAAAGGWESWDVMSKEGQQILQNKLANLTAAKGAQDYIDNLKGQIVEASDLQKTAESAANIYKNKAIEDAGGDISKLSGDTIKKLDQAIIKAKEFDKINISDQARRVMTGIKTKLSNIKDQLSGSFDPGDVFIKDWEVGNEKLVQWLQRHQPAVLNKIRKMLRQQFNSEELLKTSNQLNSFAEDAFKQANLLAAANPFDSWLKSLETLQMLNGKWQMAMPKGWGEAQTGAAKKYFDAKENADSLQKSVSYATDLAHTIAEMAAKNPFQAWVASIKEVDAVTGRLKTPSWMNSDTGKKWMGKMFDTKEMLALIDTFATGVTDIFDNMFQHIRDHGFKGLVAELRNEFTKMLADMAMSYLKSKLHQLITHTLVSLFKLNENDVATPQELLKSAAKDLKIAARALMHASANLGRGTGGVLAFGGGGGGGWEDILGTFLPGLIGGGGASPGSNIGGYITPIPSLAGAEVGSMSSSMRSIPTQSSPSYHFTYHVSTPDASSFRRAQAQTIREARGAADRYEIRFR